MKESSGPKGDFHEKKEEIIENIDEINEVEKVIEKFEDTFEILKRNKKAIENNVKKTNNLGSEGLEKLKDQLQTFKNEVQNLYTDTQDTKDQLEELQKDLGDFGIPSNL